MLDDPLLYHMFYKLQNIVLFRGQSKTFSTAFFAGQRFEPVAHDNWVCSLAGRQVMIRTLLLRYQRIEISPAPAAIILPPLVGWSYRHSRAWRGEKLLNH